jgi:hypothetical protein
MRKSLLFRALMLAFRVRAWRLNSGASYRALPSPNRAD